ncbi:hypothetical protein HDV57DRAFT_481219 [Trichoderma longibrachiatum]
MRCIAFLSTACPLIGSAWPRLFGATKRTDDINRFSDSTTAIIIALPLGNCHTTLATFRVVDLSGAYLTFVINVS